MEKHGRYIININRPILSWRYGLGLALTFAALPVIADDQIQYGSSVQPICGTVATGFDACNSGSPQGTCSVFQGFFSSQPSTSTYGFLPEFVKDPLQCVVPYCFDISGDRQCNTDNYSYREQTYQINEIPLEHSHDTEPDDPMCEADITYQVAWLAPSGTPTNSHCTSMCLGVADETTSSPTDTEGESLFRATVISTGESCSGAADPSYVNSVQLDSNGNVPPVVPDNPAPPLPDPIDPIDPADPTDPTDPTDPADPAGPDNPDSETDNTDGDSDASDNSDSSNTDNGSSSGSGTGDGTFTAGGETPGEPEEAPAPTVTGGDECTAPPSCTGDTIGCALLLQQHYTRCDAQQPVTESEALEGTGLSEWTPDMLVQNEIDLPSAFDETGFLASRACPSDIPLNIYGQTYSISLKYICQIAEVIGMLMMFLGIWHATRIVAEF